MSVVYPRSDTEVYRDPFGRQDSYETCSPSYPIQRGSEVRVDFYFCF